jgi:GT2 family glycosyltransferase
MKLSIIIINYNSWSFLGPCIDSIREKARGIEYEIIVVDNNSSDGSVDLIRSKYPETVLICNDNNAGFAKANNQAASVARGRVLFLLNADTILLDYNLADAVRYAEENGISVLGPRLVGEDRRVQTSWRLENSICRHIGDIVKMSLFMTASRKSGGNAPGSPLEVGFLSGAALLISRSDSEALGLFDERFFFTGEERDLCMRYTAAGRRICYYPGWEVLHYGGSGEVHGAFHIVNWIKSSIKLASKHGGIFAGLCMRFALGLFLLTYSTSFLAQSIVLQKDRFKLAKSFLRIMLWYFRLVPEDRALEK